MNTYAIAVDLGATNVRVALIESNGRIIHKIKNLTPKKGKNARIISDTIIEMIGMIMSARPDIRPIGIGIASVGPLDYRHGGPVHSSNIPFAFVPLVRPLQKKFSLPVLLLNDANAGVRGEQHFGAGKNKKNLVYITISTGIGGGVIMDGNVLLGKSGNAAEIGHMIIDSTYKIACMCKKGIGHWEGYASGQNIPQFFRTWAKYHGKPISTKSYDAKGIFDQARAGDTLARHFLDELNRINARAISNIIVSYDPELITIGGSVMLQNADLLLTGIQKYIDHLLPVPEIRITLLGEDIGLLGAAAAVFEHVRS